MDGDDGARPGWPTPQREQAYERLAPMWLALGGTLTLALAIAAVVTWLGLRSLHVRQFKPEPQLSATTLYDLLKVAFAVAVGIGGVVALVTAYRRQRVAEFAHELAARIEDRADRGEEENQKLAARTEEREATRLLNERFATAAGQLGSESPAVRLAGIYAMAGLADDWPQRRQTCVDVLCAYLRMPYAPEPAADAAQPDRQAYQATQEVRHTAIRIITAHLAPYRRPATPQDWCGLDLDFTGTIFDSGTVDFSGAQFTGGTVNFRDAQFTGGTVNFSSAQFTGGTVNFSSAQFTGATVNFRDAQFTGATVDFSDAQFAGGTVYFSDVSPSPAPASSTARPSLPTVPSTSAAPSSPAAPSTSAALGSPAAPSTSATPSSPAPPSTSAALGSPAPPSTSATPSSPAAPSTSATQSGGCLLSCPPGMSRRPECSCLAGLSQERTGARGPQIPHKVTHALR